MLLCEGCGPIPADFQGSLNQPPTTAVAWVSSGLVRPTTATNNNLHSSYPPGH